MQWFQYRAGVVLDSLRVAHRAAQPASDDVLQSWCRRTFHPEHVEEVCEPDTLPEAGVAAPLVPCVPCLLLVIAATDNPRSRTDIASQNIIAPLVSDEG